MPGRKKPLDPSTENACRKFQSKAGVDKVAITWPFSSSSPSSSTAQLPLHTAVVGSNPVRSNVVKNLSGLPPLARPEVFLTSHELDDEFGTQGPFPRLPS